MASVICFFQARRLSQWSRLCTPESRLGRHIQPFQKRGICLFVDRLVGIVEQGFLDCGTCRVQQEFRTVLAACSIRSRSSGQIRRFRTSRLADLTRHRWTFGSPEIHHGVAGCNDVVITNTHCPQGWCGRPCLGSRLRQDLHTPCTTSTLARAEAVIAGEIGHLTGGLAMLRRPMRCAVAAAGPGRPRPRRRSRSSGTPSVAGTP